jgi:hypothetical protein
MKKDENQVIIGKLDQFENGTHNGFIDQLNANIISLHKLL